MTPAVQHGLLVDTAAGMQYLYKNGVEHRDLKSANCLVTHDWRVKVLLIMGIILHMACTWLWLGLLCCAPDEHRLPFSRKDVPTHTKRCLLPYLCFKSDTK